MECQTSHLITNELDKINKGDKALKELEDLRPGSW